MDNQALVPDMPMLTSDEAEEANADIQKAVEADQAKAEVIMSAGWEQIVSILDAKIESFRTGSGLTIDKNTSLEEIGKKFVIASTIASICEEIKADVINAANGVLEHGSGTDK